MCLRVYLILARDKRRQLGETRDPLTRTSRTAKRARGNDVRHECRKLHESIRGEASVSIYILTLVLSRILSARVYSRQKMLRELFGTPNLLGTISKSWLL